MTNLSQKKWKNPASSYKSGNGGTQGFKDLSGDLSGETLVFSVIGPGLGLGTLVQANGSRVPETSPSKAVTSVQNFEKYEKSGIHDRLKKDEVSLTAPKGRSIPISSSRMPSSKVDQVISWVHRGFIDLVIVLLSLWVVFTAALLASALATPKGFKSSFDQWLSLRPIALLSGLSPWVALTGLVLVYTAYVVMFKIIVGRTLGGCLVGRGQTQAPQGIGAHRRRRSISV